MAANDQLNAASIRLVLLDDQVLLRSSIARLLAAEPGFSVVGECGTPAEALDCLGNSLPDVVLLDFDLAVDHEVKSFMPAARAVGCAARYLVLAGTADVLEDSALALKLGAYGIVLKSEPPERLIRAIRCVVDGVFCLTGK